MEKAPEVLTNSEFNVLERFKPSKIEVMRESIRKEVEFSLPDSETLFPGVPTEVVEKCFWCRNLGGTRGVFKTIHLEEPEMVKRKKVTKNGIEWVEYKRDLKREKVWANQKLEIQLANWTCRAKQSRMGKKPIIEYGICDPINCKMYQALPEDSPRFKHLSKQLEEFNKAKEESQKKKQGRGKNG